MENIQLFNTLYWTCYFVYIARACAKYVVPSLETPDVEKQYLVILIDFCMIAFFERKKRKYVEGNFSFFAEGHRKQNNKKVSFSFSIFFLLFLN